VDRKGELVGLSRVEVFLEESEDLEVFLSLLMRPIHMHKSEILTQSMSLKGLTKKHLPCPNHAAPTSIACIERIEEVGLEGVSVSYPSDGAK